RKTGVTTFFIDEKIDTGSIISNKEVEIEEKETAETLHDKLMQKGSELVLETLQLIENGNVVPKPQPNSGDLKVAPKLTPENTQINWSKTGKEIDAFIIGLSPYRVSWTRLYNNGEKLKAKSYSASFENTKHNLTAGTMQSFKKEMKVACADGYILVEEIQLPGKR